MVAAAVPLRTRLVRLAGAVVAMIVSGGWYLLLVELWPASSRPYIGGSQNNSIVELALGYNGVGRLTGSETGGLGNMNFDVGWGRLFGSSMGPYVAWLLPAALICIVAGFVLTRRAPRTDVTRAGLILWGTWLVVTAAVFSFANGILHQYYTVALAPAVGAGIGIGAILLWRNRSDIRVTVAMSTTVIVTVVLADVLLARRSDWQPWLPVAIAVTGVGAAVLLLVVMRLPARVSAGVAALSIVACLAAPTAYAIATAATPHSGAVPTVGPAGGHGSFGGVGGFVGPPPGGFGGQNGRPPSGFDGRGGPPPGGFGGGGGFLDIPKAGADLSRLLSDGADGYRWTAAVVGSSNAAGYQLASEAPVMAVGGFNGTDPAPTLDQFRADVAARQIHYFIQAHAIFGGRGESGSRASADVSAWVESHYAPTTVNGVVVYDLTSAPTIVAPTS